MGTITLGFQQRDASRGTCNTVELALADIEYEVERLQFDFVHENSVVREPGTLDAYLFGTLMFAMQHADALAIKGPVTTRALRNAHAFMEAWRSWRPDVYRVVDLQPESTISDREAHELLARRPAAGRAIAAFSGGADSMFSALRHGPRGDLAVRHEVTDVVMVHGFDVVASNHEGFSALRSRVEPFLAAIGLNLRVVWTNLRQRAATSAEHQAWEHSFGAQLACVLHQFSGEFSHGIVGSSEPYTHPIVAWGSTPATDYLLSGGLFEIVHDGAGFSRTQKIQRLASYAPARRFLKVCWEGADVSRNCGRCEKCIRTRLNFAAVGSMDPECFDSPFDASLIDGLQVRSVPQLAQLKSILDHADSRGDAAEWVELLRSRVDAIVGASG